LLGSHISVAEIGPEINSRDPGKIWPGKSGQPFGLGSPFVAPSISQLTVARVRAENGDAAAFRLMQAQAMRAGQRRIELSVRIAEIEGPAGGR
jgi:hypothetical protein